MVSCSQFLGAQKVIKVRIVLSNRVILHFLSQNRTTNKVFTLLLELHGVFCILMGHVKNSQLQNSAFFSKDGVLDIS